VNRSRVRHSEWSRRDASDIDGIKPKGRNEGERVSQFGQRRIESLKRLNSKKSFETHSLPTLTRSYLRRFTFYVTDPLSSIRRGGPVAAATLPVLDPPFG
jgi:hypothetical protein